MRETTYLAIDLGAESGRAILGRLDGETLEMEEVHRFSNEPVTIHGTLSWDFPQLLRNVREGIRRGSERAGGRLDGVAVDSWGVDFGLLDGDGRLLRNPVHYRDTGHVGVLERVLERVPRETIWSRTGVQLLEINTLFQLVATGERDPELLTAAETLLPIADLVAFFLGARPCAEVTLASPSQLLDAHSHDWSDELIASLDLPRRIFPEIVPSGTVTGALRKSITSEAGLSPPPPIIAAASHDTAAAVACMPGSERHGAAYLSSGTWSLLGVEVDAPVTGISALEKGFTNEAGVAGKTRLLTNITGLWLVQECRRQWVDEGVELSYEELARLARNAEPARFFVDPDDPRFAAPGDMPSRIREACAEAGGDVPESRVEILRVVFESLARRYARGIEDVESLTGHRVERLHVMGGGSRNGLLNQLTADAVGLPVLAGPTEATAMGNILVQALATGALRDLTDIRRVSSSSSELESFAPQR